MDVGGHRFPLGRQVGNVVRRRLSSVAALALIAVGLTACGGGHDEGTVAQRPYTAVARFVPGDEVTVIQVIVSDRQPLRGADLIGLDGVAIPADSIDAKQVAVEQQPFFREPVGGALGTGGAGMAQPLGGLGAFAPAGSQTVSSGQIQSTASIRLPDPAAYAKDWRFWQIRLRIGDPPHVTVLDLPSPQPPPSL